MDKNLHKTYGIRKTDVVVWIYVISIIVWMILFYLLGLYKYGLGMIIFGLIPILVLGVAIANAGEVEIEQDASLFQIDTLALLGVFVFLAWNQSENEDRTFWIALLLGIIFTLIASFDLWVKKKWLPVVKHIRSVLTTLGISLILVSIYLYLLEQLGNKPKSKKFKDIIQDVQ